MPTTDSAGKTSAISSPKPAKRSFKPNAPMSQEEMDALYREHVRQMNKATGGLLYKDFQFSISKEDLRFIRGQNGELIQDQSELPTRRPNSKPDSWQRLRLWLPGYKPPSQNRLNGNGFRGFNQEKNRAHAALSSALRSAAAAPATGTTAGSKDYRTLSSTLEHFLMTRGSTSSKAASGPRKSRPKKTKAP